MFRVYDALINVWIGIAPKRFQYYCTRSYIGVSGKRENSIENGRLSYHFLFMRAVHRRDTWRTRPNPRAREFSPRPDDDWLLAPVFERFPFRKLWRFGIGEFRLYIRNLSLKSYETPRRTFVFTYPRGYARRVRQIPVKLRNLSS